MTDTSTFSSDEQAQFDAMKETTSAEPVKAEVEVEAHEPEGQQPQEQRQKTVPHEALHSERERRKAAERAAQELRERLAYLEGQRVVSQPKEEQRPPIPDPDEDPIGALKAQRDILLRQQQERVQAEQQMQQQRQQDAFVNDVKGEWDGFVKDKPEAAEAYKHIREARARELMLMGYQDINQMNQILNQEELQAMVAARRAGKNIGEYVMEIAGYRGWQPKAQPQPVKDGREASKSLSGVGSSPTGPMTVERLVSMSQSDFEAYQTKNPDVVRRLMGG